MVTLWIGDFRIKQIQTLYKAAQQAAEYYYLTDDLAEYSWFVNNAITQLPTMSLESANVVIALGFNDCVYSCVWNTFKIDQIAKQYSAAINNLKTEYSNINLYVCSVNPVDAGYPFSESVDGIITQKQLNDKIKLFNSTLKKDCKAAFIDSHSYLADTSFNTRDGIRYIPDTTSTLHSYITSVFNNTSTSLFSPRISAPDSKEDSYIYWMQTADGGENPFTMPSCAAYAWGRFYEIISETPKLSVADPEYWYSYTTDGYKRGSTPKVGAIACWQNGAPGGSDYGYVAIVEQVKDDGSIITSEIDAAGTWQLITRTKDTGNWGMAGTYHFLGFIYCPLTVSISKEDICTKNSYNVSIDEMKPNAQYIYSYLSDKGWTLNAIAGMLGNMQVESKMSPWSWQGAIEGSIINEDGTHSLNTAVLAGKSPGYGLVQWTPYSKFIDWCISKELDYWDIDSQLQRITWEVEKGDQWGARPSKGFDLSFEEFITSTKDSSWLAEAFAFCYERPGSSTGTEAQQNALRAERSANGEFWYNYLSTLSFDTISNNKLKINGFKVDDYQASQASISFFVRNSASGKCTLLKNNNKVSSKKFDIKSGYKTFTFKDLIPNTDYTIQLEAGGENEEKVVRDIAFKTLQDYPYSPKSIEFTTSDKIKSTNSLFTLKVTKPERLGYWKSTSGYDIMLLVNNKTIKTVSITNANQDISWKNFTIKSKFDYECKTGDSIQIGVRVWVKDSTGKKLYDSGAIKCSASICLLNRPISLYINK